MENNQRNSRKRLNSLILLVAFTAVMLIVSTYAWFSTQRNVLLSGLKGQVNVAEGLQVSLDAKNWVNTIDFDDFNQPVGGDWTVKDSATSTYLDSGKTFQAPADGITNVIPKEYLPVSTTGEDSDGIGQSIIKMYGGTYTDSEGLKGITLQNEAATSGYFAFDLYLMNTSKEEIQSDKLQLDSNSDVTGGNESTGIQNTVRVGLALYENSGDAMKIGQETEPTQAKIIEGTSTGKTIKDFAIWEPNSDKHVDNIVNSSSNKLRLSKSDRDTYSLIPNNAGISKFADGNALPTYALTSGSATADSIANVYDWETDRTSTSGSLAAYEDKGLKKQKVTATKDESRSASIDLLSVSDGEKAMEVVANQYQKIRVYVWIEGQDPDCINYASLGQSLTLNLGLSKPETATSSSSD